MTDLVAELRAVIRQHRLIIDFSAVQSDRASISDLLHAFVHWCISFSACRMCQLAALP